MTIAEFLRILRERWTIVVVSILVVIGAAAAVTLSQKPVYQASTRIYLSTKAAEAKPGENQVLVQAISREDLLTYVEVLGSSAVQDPLRQQLGLAPGAPLDVSAEVSDQINVLQVTARAGSGPEAARIANAVGPVLAAAAEDFSPLVKNSGGKVHSTTLKPAVDPGSPLSPNPKRNLALAALLGLAVGIGLALLRHAMDTKVRDTDDLRELSERPVLGQVPVLKDRRLGLAVETDPYGPYAEAIRRLRTNMLFVDVTTRGHAAVITSAGPAEGKTSTATNLARAMADTGSRVLLVDGDLRNPRVARFLGLENDAGLTTVLLGRATVADVVQPWGETTMDVLTAGEIPPNPSELIGSEAMAEAFASMRTAYDFVLIDSPPSNPVSDAILLNRLAKNLIMVVASDRTKKRELNHALTTFTTVDIEPAGFVLNMVPMSVMTTRYGSYAYGQTANEHAPTRSQRKQARRVSERAAR